MGLLDLLKTAKDLLTGNEVYGEDSSNQQRSYIYDDENVDDNVEYDNDGGDTDEDDGALNDADVSRFEDALRTFYSGLSQEELDDEDLDNLINEVQDKFFEGKIKDPLKALNATYRKWKQSNIVEKRANDRKIIIDMLRRYDELSEEEKASLIDWDSEYCLGKLKKEDGKAVAKIIQSWYDNRTLDEQRLKCIDMISSSSAEAWDGFPGKISDETPLTENEYNFWLKKWCHCSYANYKDSAEYFKRYWLKSGNKPQPIESDELIVNRPCYFIDTLLLATPHFHMSKRYFEDDSYQDAKVYLFADSLEMIVDGGHQVISLMDIIDININNWRHIEFQWGEVSHWRDVERGWYGDATNSEPCPEFPEPYLVEITCRNQGKYLFTLKNGELEKLLVLRALMFYFIKNPQ